MNQCFFLESMLLALLYMAMGIVIVERVTRIYIFIIVGYVQELYIKNGVHQKDNAKGGWGL